MPINPEKWTKNYLYEHMLLLIRDNARKLDPETGLPAIVKIFNGGGTRCFSAEQKVITRRGSLPISDIKSGDYVVSHNHDSGHDEFKQVLDVIKTQKNTKKCLKITLKNGKTIKCTEDHEIYYQGRYIYAKDLVYLCKFKTQGNGKDNNKIVYD